MNDQTERPSDKLPKFAKKADDLEAIKKAVDDAASVSGALWFSYIFVLFYLAVAAGAVTHADLFLENSVKLPFLGVDLPLVAFSFLAPILFLIVHAYVLVHLVMLTDKAKRFHQVLDEQIGVKRDLSEDHLKRREVIRDGLRRQLTSNIFVQMLAGPSQLRNGAFGVALFVIAWLTLVVGPVLLLLMMQIQFLPHHSSFIAWTQRAALLADLVLIHWLWARTLSGGEAMALPPWVASASGVMGPVLAVYLVFFSVFVASFPGEWQNELPNQSRFWFPYPKPEDDRVTLSQLIFQSRINEKTGHRDFPISNTLVLTGFNIYEGIKTDDPDKLKWRDYVFRPHDRDLRGAIFDRAGLPRVDFSDADLKGARFEAAHLEGASFDHAALDGAWLKNAALEGAMFEGAHLQGASLDDARLQGAWFRSAELQAASLKGANLSGAGLEGANLQAASLDNAKLQGALLSGAQLQGVSFASAILKATLLRGAYLWRSNHKAGDLPEDSAIEISEDDNTWKPRRQDSLAPDKAWYDDDHKNTA